MKLGQEDDMKRIGLLVALVIASWGMCGSARADSVTVQATDLGSFLGISGGGGFFRPPGSQVAMMSGGTLQQAAYLVFDLSGITANVTGVQLHVPLISGTGTLLVNDVSSSPALLATALPGNAASPAASVYFDLTNTIPGAQYASVSGDVTGLTSLDISLNADAVADLNAAKSTTGTFSLGLAPGASGGMYLFNDPDLSLPADGTPFQLLITTDGPNGILPLPSAFGAGILLLGGCVVGLRPKRLRLQTQLA
jgi:hypothetical protein